MSSTDTTNSASAVISRCGFYRYELLRMWDERKPTCCWVMLNPSTADATQDDPTIRRCINFALGWGYGAIVVVNLFSLPRATDPKELRKFPDPVGPLTDQYILKWGRNCEGVVAAWGCDGKYRQRNHDVVELLKKNNISIHALGLTKDGHPKHPLYLKSDLKLFKWCPQLKWSPHEPHV